MPSTLRAAAKADSSQDVFLSQLIKETIHKELTSICSRLEESCGQAIQKQFDCLDPQIQTHCGNQRKLSMPEAQRTAEDDPMDRLIVPKGGSYNDEQEEPSDEETLSDVPGTPVHAWKNENGNNPTSKRRGTRLQNYLQNNRDTRRATRESQQDTRRATRESEQDTRIKSFRRSSTYSADLVEAKFEEEEEDMDKNDSNFRDGPVPRRNAMSSGVDIHRRVLSRRSKGNAMSLGVDIHRRVQCRIAKDSMNTTWFSSGYSAKALVSHPTFDNIVGLFIVFNAVIIGVQADYSAKNRTETVPLTYQIFEYIFAFVFTTELLLRIYVMKFSFFYSRSAGTMAWNYFDLFIVAAQLLELTCSAVLGSKGREGSARGASNFRLFRVLRILRLVRILRIVRVLHLVAELRTLISSILGCFRSLAWTMVLLFLMIYIVGVYFTQSVTEVMVEKEKDGTLDIDYPPSGPETQIQKLWFYFGGLDRTILSLWQAISGGTDWEIMVDPLITDVQLISGFAFVAYIAFATLALLNVVTGNFVHTALSRAQEEEDNFLADRVCHLFDMVATNNEHSISYSSLEGVLEDPIMECEWKAINVNKDEAKYLFKILDIEDEGEIRFSEFLRGCLRLRGTSKSLDMLILTQEARCNALVVQNMLNRMGNQLDEIQKCAQLLSNKR